MGFFNHLPLESEGTFLSRLMAQLVIILVLPRILHFTLMQHLLQPRVISEIVSGIILGPSCLGQVHGFTDLFFPTRSLTYLNSLGQMGVVLFLFMTGLHLNVQHIWEYKYMAVICSFGAIATTFAVAPGLAFAFDDTIYHGFNFEQSVILMAILLSIPAEAVMARILAERGLLQSKLGSLCMATDTIGLIVCFILLSAVLALYGAENPWVPPANLCPGTVVVTPNDAEDIMDPLYIVLCLVGVILALLTVIRYVCGVLVKRTAKKGKMETVIFVASMVLCFAVAYVTQTLTLSHLLGPFMLGLLSFPRDGTLTKNIESALQPITVGILLPVFFALVGLNTNWVLLGAKEIGLAFLLLGALWVTTFTAALLISTALTGRGFKNFYFATLLTCKGLTALTIFNILFSVGVITKLFYALIVLYALVSCAVVSPIVYFAQQLRTYLQSRNPAVGSSIERAGSSPNLPDQAVKFHLTLALPSTAFLAPVAATVAAWVAASMPEPGLTMFARLIGDIDQIEEHIPLLQDPIPPAILTTDQIFGPALVRWSGIRPPGKVAFRAVIANNLEKGFIKLVGGDKRTDHHPYDFLVLGYDHTTESKRLVLAALALSGKRIVIVTGQPAIALSGAHSALAINPSPRETQTLRDLFLQQPTSSTMVYWKAGQVADRPPEVQAAKTPREVLNMVADTPDLSIEAIFCPLPSFQVEMFELLNAAFQCHIPVIFEGDTFDHPQQLDEYRKGMSDIRVEVDPHRETFDSDDSDDSDSDDSHTDGPHIIPVQIQQ